MIQSAGARVVRGPLRKTVADERAQPVEVAFDAAFVSVFHASHDDLFRYLNRMSGDPELAKDLAQETFVRLYRRGELPGNCRAWVFTVGTNLFRNATVKRRNRSRLMTADRGSRVLSDPAPAPDRRAESNEVRSAVRVALDVLSERQRALLLLAAEGHTYEEISTILQLAEGSVGTLLRRAKAAVRNSFEGGPDASR